MVKFFKKRKKKYIKGKVIHVNSIEEMDDIIHENVINSMKCKENGMEMPENEIVKFSFSKEIMDKYISVENIYEILMMKSVDRVLNDDYLKDDKSRENFEKVIYPILCNNEKVTYH